MPRYEVVTTVTERFRIVVDAPSAEVAQAIVTRERELSGLDDHFVDTPDVSHDVNEGLPDYEEPYLSYNRKEHGTAEALLSEYGGR